MGTGAVALHRARFAKHDELKDLLSPVPRSDGVLLGTKRHLLFFKRFAIVRPTTKRREIGNTLVVAPTRGGKGLLAISQLLSWQHSVVVNDIKGDLYTATAGYRSTLGPVFVIDPTGIGHCYDPLQNKHTEDELLSSATHLLHQPDEGEGRIFTQRATGMLTQLLLAAKQEGIPPLPYVRYMVRLGLGRAVKRLHSVSPLLATQFLEEDFAQANLSDRFLLSAWGTLSARIRPLLTETVVRCFTRSEFDAKQLLQSEAPITIYFRWREQDLLALSPLVKLMWGTLINEMLTTYDTSLGKHCHPVLLLIDEAAKTAIPNLDEHASTVAGRGISLWIAIQSLSQLQAAYGKARADVLRDNMETQLYYRPADLQTAQYLEERLGTRSAYAHSTTLKDGEETSEGQTERPIPLLTAQEIMQLNDEEIIGFHRKLPPFHIHRMDWREHQLIRQRHSMPPPELASLPPLAEIPPNPVVSQIFSFSDEYIDPDMPDLD
jgi:type IV secretion system protein VirD4